MKRRMLADAMFKFRNISFIIVWIFLVFATDALLTGAVSNGNSSLKQLGLVSGLLIYLTLVVHSLSSRNFRENFSIKEKIRYIQGLNHNCVKAAKNAKRYASSVYLQRLRKVMHDKEDILTAYFRGDRSYPKEKITEQALNLTAAYAKLLADYCMRLREIKEIDLREIANRITTNKRKLNFINDQNMIEDVKGLINIDEKIICRIKEEKKELERISAKLEFMESAIVMFKHQIICNLDSVEAVNRLEKVINEVNALNLALDYGRKNRVNI